MVKKNSNNQAMNRMSIISGLVGILGGMSIMTWLYVFSPLTPTPREEITEEKTISEIEMQNLRQEIKIDQSNITIPTMELEGIVTLLPKIKNQFKTDVFDLIRDFRYVTFIKWGYPHMPESSHDYEIIFSESEPAITGDETIYFYFKSTNISFSSLFQPQINYYKDGSEKSHISINKWLLGWYISLRTEDIIITDFY